MNSRIINYQISRKVKNWLDSITDKDLREYLADKVIVTGGCIASMLLNEKVSDYDLYFLNKESVLRTAHYYVDLFKKNHPKLSKTITVVDGDDPEIKNKWTNENGELESKFAQYGVGPGRVVILVHSDGVAGDDKDISDPENLIEDEEKKDAEAKKEEEPKKEYKPVYLTSNAITLSDKVQLVIRFYGEPDEVHKSFDFLHCLNYWSSKDQQLHLNPKALECLLTKELKYVGSKYPLCSIIRLRKFISRGFHINAGEILKICFQLSELNLKDIPTLADQLVGVDTTYFSLLISKMQTKKEKDTEFEVSYGYLASVLDEIYE